MNSPRRPRPRHTHLTPPRQQRLGELSARLATRDNPHRPCRLRQRPMRTLGHPSHRKRLSRRILKELGFLRQLTHLRGDARAHLRREPLFRGLWQVLDAVALRQFSQTRMGR